MGSLTTPGTTAGARASDTNSLKNAALNIRKIRLSAQRELEMAKQVRIEAQRYQQVTEAKARSQTQQLILKTRLAAREAIQNEIESHIRGDFEDMVNQALAEVQKTLADIRAIRITAQEELATLKKLIDAAKIISMGPLLPQDVEESDAIDAIRTVAELGKKQLTANP